MTIADYFWFFLAMFCVTSPITGLIYIIYRIATDKPKPRTPMTLEQLQDELEFQKKATTYLFLKNL